MQKLGFSLLELLVTMSIIMLLTLLAIPSYRKYAERARFTEILLSVAPFRTAIAVALQSGDPIDSLETGMHGLPPAPPPTQNLASLEVSRGVITATSTDAAGGYTYILTPDPQKGTWSVSGTCLKAGLCR